MTHRSLIEKSASNARGACEDAEELEYFMEDVDARSGTLRAMEFGKFTALRTLRIVKQRGVVSIDGIAQCATLRVLVVAECGIRELDGALACAGLEAVYAYGNAIESLRSLGDGTLMRLRTLWVNDNKLTTLEGCEGLRALRELNAARNAIENVPSVGALRELEYLNVAGNPIRTWTALEVASELKSLTLRDDVHGACALAQTKWFRSYAVAALPNLETLDGVAIDDDERARAREELAHRRLSYNAKCAQMRHEYRKARARAQESWNAANTEILCELLRARASNCVCDITRALQRANALEHEFQLCDDIALKNVSILAARWFQDAEIVRETALESRFTFAIADSESPDTLQAFDAIFTAFIKKCSEFVIEQTTREVIAHKRNLTEVVIASHVISLNLHAVGLADVPSEISECTNLQTLQLSDNVIHRLTSLPRLHTLAALDLGNNKLWNSDDLYTLSSQAPNLSWLCLRGNCQLLANRKFYTRVVVNRLTKLEIIDGSAVSAHVRTSCRAKPAALTVDFMNSRGIIFPPHSAPEKVAELSIEGESIRKIADLEAFTSLRVAYLGGNCLRSLKTFSVLRQLRHLSIEGNSVVRLDGLSSLTELRWLNIKGCGLAHISPAWFKTLSKLEHLNMEDNQITALGALAQCSSLRELYVGGNKIADIGAIAVLASIATLRLFSTYGNELREMKSYTSYVIFKLPQLEILDADYISDAARIAAAKMYTGRLTEDMLNTREEVNCREIELVSLGLAYLDHAVTSSRFKYVKHLNLENNNLTDVSALGDLPLLTRLRLKSNRINAVFGRANQFKSLSFLDLSSNYVSSLSALALGRCAGLRTLLLCDNFLTRLDGINRLSALRVCYVDGNKLSRIEANTFIGCDNLKIFSARRNALRTLKHLSNLESIRELQLDDNRIDDIEEVSWLTRLIRLKSLSLMGNKIATGCERYFEFVSTCCRSLAFLDGKRVVGQ